MGEGKKYQRLITLDEKQKNFFDNNSIKPKSWFLNILDLAIELKEHKIDIKDVLDEKIIQLNDVGQK